MLFVLFMLSCRLGFAQVGDVRDASRAEKAGDLERALRLYEDVLRVQTSDTKSMLRVAGHILKIYKQRGESLKVEQLLRYLKEQYSPETFDLKDIEKLARIFSEYGSADEAVRLRCTIVDAPFLRENLKVTLRVSARLLEYYRSLEDSGAAADLFERLSLLPLADFDDRDFYSLAMLHLKYGKRAAGMNLLDDLTEIFPHSVSARKALFVLAKEAQREEDYPRAIHYYVSYTKKYPDSTFYVQKAYQRIVDCTLMQREEKFSRDLMQQVADWVNGVSDYRSRLNLAADLKLKNMDDLAEAVYGTGIEAAERVIDEHPGSYEALKAHLEILRTAHVFGLGERVEEEVLSILKGCEEWNGESALDESVSFIESQGYLWLARLRRDHERYVEAVSLLRTFLDRYPDHKDRSYAFYELGIAYEKMGERGKAGECFEKVDSEPLMSRARERLGVAR